MFLKKKKKINFLKLRKIFQKSSTLSTRTKLNMSNQSKSIVIDIGSGNIKAGFAGSENPKCIIPSILGRPKYIATLPGGPCIDTYVGDMAIENSGVLIIKNFIERGYVTNWDDFIKTIHFCYHDLLQIDPKEYSALLTEVSKNSRSNREKLIQIMFEDLNIGSFYVGSQGYFSFLSSGRDTGAVLEVGDGSSQIVPIYESNIIKHAVSRLNIGGCDVTSYLQEILLEKGLHLTTSADFQIVRDIKEKCSYFALDFESELQKAKSSSSCDFTYTLPDGEDITISTERFSCQEFLFKPNMNGFELHGLDNALINSIKKCDSRVHKSLYSNIILSGGATTVDGFPERFHKEINNLVPSSMNLKVLAPPERKYSAWKGASIFASKPNFQKICITHDEYNDNGPLIVHRKCY